MSGLDALFAPRGVGIIGASREQHKLGAVMARSMHAYGAGPLLVNARPEARCHLSMQDAVSATGLEVDLAVVCVPAAACAEAVTDAAHAGVRAVLVCSGGFAETGPDGALHQRALLDAARKHGVRVLGPNTSGFIVPRIGLTASFVAAAAELPEGSVAVVAASGGVNHALAFDIANAGNGISLAVGVGGGVDIAAAELLEYLADDEATTVIALHLESVPDGQALLSAVRNTSAMKPIVVLVVGRSDVGDFAQSHTGALATSWRTTRALLRQAGAVVVDDERELVDAVTALSRVRLGPSADPGVGVVTAQAGPGLLLVDALRSSRVRVPELGDGTQRVLSGYLPPMTFQRNPVDTGRPGDTFHDVVTAVAADNAIDMVATYALLEPDALDLASTFIDLPAHAIVATGGPADQVAEVRSHLHKLGTPLLGGPTAAANAVRALVTDARARADVPGTPTRLPAIDLPGGALHEAAAKDLLDTLGIATPARRVCADQDAAHRALAQLGGAVAVKLLDASVLHKSDVGGVQLGVRTVRELDRALAEIGAGPYLVEAMAEPGVDVIVGARRDPVFGPIVLLGLGGTAAEVLADVAVRAVPLSAHAGAAMVDDLDGRALLAGYRGAPAVDELQLGEVIAKIGALLAAVPELAEIEINPLRVTAGGLVALDAVVLREDGERHGN